MSTDGPSDRRDGIDSERSDGPDVPPMPSLAAIWELDAGQRMKQDPVSEAYADERDLYDIATWEPRSRLDHYATRFYTAVRENPTQTALVIVGTYLLLSVLFTVLGLLLNPSLVPATLASLLPAILLVGYFWYAFDGRSALFRPLLVTFAVAGIVTNLAIIPNNAFQGVAVIPAIGGVFYMFLVVAPVEESVKLLSVRLSAYRMPSFDTVVCGAIFGGVAGLGFAFTENVLYLSRGTPVLVRAVAPTMHVTTSAIAGYYLGLARFTEQNAGPAVVKGLFIAATVHAVHNTLSSVLVPGDLAMALLVNTLVVLVALAFLLRKMRTYRALREEIAGAAGDAAAPASGTDESDRTDAEREPGQIAQFRNLQELHRAGVLTDEEFEEKRRELIGQI